MRQILSCRSWAASGALICLISAGAATAAPGRGGRAAFSVAPAAHALGAHVALRRGVQRDGAAAFRYRGGGYAFNHGGAVPFYPGTYGRGFGSIPFHGRALGRDFGRLGRGGRDGYGGALYADWWPGAIPDSYPVDPPVLFPGAPAMPVALGIEEPPTARPQVIVINGGTGAEHSRLRRPRHTRPSGLNGADSRSFVEQGPAASGPRIIRVTVPQG